MPTLEFKGKQHIYAHHLTVPYRPLKPDESRSCNPTDTDDNLIIHGDNLHALKALLPRYANRIKCIYINKATLHLLDTADHGFKVLKRSRKSDEDVFVETARVISEWVETLN